MKCIKKEIGTVRESSSAFKFFMLHVLKKIPRPKKKYFNLFSSFQIKVYYKIFYLFYFFKLILEKTAVGVGARVMMMVINYYLLQLTAMTVISFQVI